MEWYLRT